VDIRPLNDQVLIRKDTPRDTTDGGIAIPDTAKKESVASGIVLVVGPGSTAMDGTRVPIDVKVGQRVFFNGHSGSDLDVRGQTNLVVVSEFDLLAVPEA
jgi:chaperonin GroES